VHKLDNNVYDIRGYDVAHAFDVAAKNYDNASVLQKAVVERLIESFDLIKTNPLLILDMGSGTGYGSRILKKRFKKAQYFQSDISREMLKIAQKQSPRYFSNNHFVCADASQMPIQDNQFDLVFSNLMLQWCKDLDFVFAEVKRMLKPGGVFLFSSFGPDTLKELRDCWKKVDDDIHVNAFVDMHDVGDSLIRNGLHSPVLSVEHIVMTYSDCLQLMHELKSIGAQNVNKGRRKSLTGKQRLNKVIAHYETLRSNDKLPATYEVVYGHAWQPDKEKTISGDIKSQSISLDKLKQDLKSRKLI
tara:strand:+ start:865 stop:1770 length:906 start_codon:yes stop_codon:yes gene_type:complete